MQSLCFRMEGAAHDFLEKDNVSDLSFFFCFMKHLRSKDRPSYTWKSLRKGKVLYSSYMSQSFS